MPGPQRHTLSKEERLCGKTGVSALISEGKWGVAPHLRFCWAAGRGTGRNRILVSVPKKFFKRAVRRNLLKRRIREAYRLQKTALTAVGVDLMFAWSQPEAADFRTICAEVAEILGRIQAKIDASSAQ